jgi:hypothetical protein
MNLNSIFRNISKTNKISRIKKQKYYIFFHIFRFFIRNVNPFSFNTVQQQYRLKKIKKIGTFKIIVA